MRFSTAQIRDSKSKIFLENFGLNNSLLEIFQLNIFASIVSFLRNTIDPNRLSILAHCRVQNSLVFEFGFFGFQNSPMFWVRVLQVWENFPKTRQVYRFEGNVWTKHHFLPSFPAFKIGITRWTSIYQISFGSCHSGFDNLWRSSLLANVVLPLQNRNLL